LLLRHGRETVANHNRHESCNENRYEDRVRAEETMNQKLTVNGMHCNACVMLIREALEDAGATNVTITLDQKNQVGTVTLDTTLPKATIKGLVEKEGDYTVS
jgi:copper chaperone CopZ